MQKENLDQLEKILNDCIEKGWLNKIFDKGALVLEDGVYRNKGRIPMFSFHDLFSKDSGLMEAVEWNNNEITLQIVIQDVDDTNHEYEKYYNNNSLYHYMKMSHLSSEEKIIYFCNNVVSGT